MVKFKVNDVEQNLIGITYLLRSSVEGDEKAKSLAGAKPVEGFSHRNSTFLPNGDTENPLLSAVYRSFSHHLPLALTPDAIWNTIMQGVSTHVSQDPEKHRHTFVSHQGRKKLIAQDATLRRGNPNNNWGSITSRFTDQISAKLSGKSALQALNTRFTTTDETARVAHAIVFMDVVKSYFKYKVVTLCGIPSIELTGIKQDWSSMRAALTLLDELDLSPWRAQLDAILAHFENAFENRIEQAFWNDMFLKHGALGSGGVTKISGWIRSLFLYVGGELNPAAMGESKVRFEPSDFPSGLSETPFTWDYCGKKIKMLLRGGLVGVVIDPVSKTVAPQLGWLVTEAADHPTTEKKLHLQDVKPCSQRWAQPTWRAGGATDPSTIQPPCRPISEQSFNKIVLNEEKSPNQSNKVEPNWKRAPTSDVGLCIKQNKIQRTLDENPKWTELGI